MITAADKPYWLESLSRCPGELAIRHQGQLTYVEQEGSGMVIAEPAGLLVRTRDLNKSYRVGESCATALSHVNLEISRGGFTAVSGASGAGKSTLLNMLAGLGKPTASGLFRMC